MRFYSKLMKKEKLIFRPNIKPLQILFQQIQILNLNKELSRKKKILISSQNVRNIDTNILLIRYVNMILKNRISVIRKNIYLDFMTAILS